MYVPIYVYECEKCNGRFEYMQSMKEPPKGVCGSCGGPLHKVIVPTAFHLKGGGWYKDLYSSSRGSSGGGESKPSSTKSESKPETKSDSKPSGSGGSSDK